MEKDEKILFHTKRYPERLLEISVRARNAGWYRDAPRFRQVIPWSMRELIKPYETRCAFFQITAIGLGEYDVVVHLYGLVALWEVGELRKSSFFCRIKMVPGVLGSL